MLKKLGIDTRKIRLQWRIFAYLLGFCILLLVILWLFQTVFLNDFYQAIKTFEVRETASTLEKNIDRTDLQALVDSVSERDDLCVMIVNPDRTRVNSSMFNPNCSMDQLTEEKLDELMNDAEKNGGELLHFDTKQKDPSPQVPQENDPGVFMRGNPKKFRESLLLVRLKTDKEGDVTAILINSMISPVDATVSTLRVQLWIVSAILILLSVILALIIARQISKPIVQINESAKKLAKGNYDTQFPGGNYLEIHELSGTLNYMTQELQKTENLRRELLANVSHDLRTPLSLIYGYAEYMHDFPEDVSGENAETIMKEAQWLSTLVNDMLDLSKLESGAQKLQKERFDLTETLRDSAMNLGELLKGQGYAIEFSTEQPVFVCADKNKILQAFINLVNNAVNYCGEDKRVLIRLTIRDGKARVEISDHGPGVPAEDLAYIWDRYYKSDKTHKRSTNGTGLGLSIVKRIIEMHEGQYGVISCEGKGSTFWFSLPLS